VGAGEDQGLSGQHAAEEATQVEERRMLGRRTASWEVRDGGQNDPGTRYAVVMVVVVVVVVIVVRCSTDVAAAVVATTIATATATAAVVILVPRYSSLARLPKRPCCLYHGVGSGLSRAG
jgi:hypothetical protein